MNIKCIVYLVVAFILSIASYSCKDNDNVISYTSQTKDAQIYSFSIQAGYPKRGNDDDRAADTLRISEINKTRFAINQVARIIYNPDSMPYGTLLNKVQVTATYNPIYGKREVMVFTPDSINGYIWSGAEKDSIDFEKQPISFRVTSVGGTTNEYKIDIRIHKIDPDTLVWNKMPNLDINGESKTILLKDRETNQETSFYTYILSDGAVYLRALNKEIPSEWVSLNINGLPETVMIESINQLNGAFVAIDALGNSFGSADGVNWNLLMSSNNVESLVGILPGTTPDQEDEMLVIINEAGSKIFALTKDLITIHPVSNLNGRSDNTVFQSFPVRGASYYTNYDSDKKFKMLVVVGGQDANDNNLSSTWLIKMPVNGSVEMSSYMQNTSFAGVGNPCFYYDNKLYVMGNHQFYISTNWGGFWMKASVKQNIIDDIAKRSRQSVIVDLKNNIWMFGGVSPEDGTYFKDVWRGRINRLIIQ